MFLGREEGRWRSVDDKVFGEDEEDNGGGEGEGGWGKGWGEGVWGGVGNGFLKT